MDDRIVGFVVRSRKGALCRFPVILALLLLAAPMLLPGCAEDPERARTRGWKEGYEAGYRDGEQEGYEQGFEEAFGDSFDRKAADLPDVRETPRSKIRLVVYVLVFLVLGFGAQYSAVYLLRRGNILRDVDSILLDHGDASLTLKSLDPEQSMKTMFEVEDGDPFGTSTGAQDRDRD